MSEALIRPAVLNDAEDLAAVRRLSWRSAYREILPAEFLERMNAADDERRFCELMNREGREDLVSILGGKVVGYVTLCPNRDGEPDEVGEIAAIYLLPEMCGRGLGRLLFQAALSRLGERGFQSAILWVFRDNPRARRFYEQAGMHLDNQRPITIDKTTLVELRYRLELLLSPGSAE